MIDWIVGVVFSPVTFFKEVLKVNKSYGAITRNNVIGSLVFAILAVGSWYLWAIPLLSGILGFLAVVTIFLNEEVFKLLLKMAGFGCTSAAASAIIAGIAMMCGAPFFQVWMGSGVLVFVGMSWWFGL